MSHHILHIVHLLAATLWLGGLALLVLAWLPEMLRTRDPRLLWDALMRSRWVLMASLAVLVGSGLGLAWNWLPETRLWFTPDLPLARLVLAKVALATLLLLVLAYFEMRVLARFSADRLGRMGLCLVLLVLLAVVASAVGTEFRYGLQA
jgi:putative copper export protein